MTPQTQNSRAQNVLVTGGGGFLGKAIADRLVQRGDRVRCFSRGQYPDLATMGVTHISGDIGDRHAVENACQGMDLVFHVAAKAGVWGRYADYHQTNVTGTENVIAACRSCGVPHLVYTSSPSVVFDGSDMAGVDESVPYSTHYHAPYPATKALAEQSVRKAATNGLGTIILRPHLIWGPGDNHLTPRIIARARRLKRVGDGQNRVDTLYIDNAADAHILAADRLAENPALSGNVYFISQDEPVYLWDMIDRILAAAGLGPVRGAMSRNTARAIGRVLETAYRWFKIPGEPPMTRFVADELATSHWFDISAAKKDLGYKPKVSIEEGLKRLTAWLMKTPAP